MTAITNALSGMMAGTATLNATSANIANRDSTGSLSAGGKQAYQPVDVVQVSTAGGGVQATYRPARPGTQAAYQPDSPDADAAGMVAAPVSNPVQDNVDLMTSLHAFKLNAAVMQAGESLEKTAIDMLA